MMAVDDSIDALYWTPCLMKSAVAAVSATAAWAARSMAVASAFTAAVIMSALMLPMAN